MKIQTPTIGGYHLVYINRNPKYECTRVDDLDGTRLLSHANHFYYWICRCRRGVFVGFKDAHKTIEAIVIAAIGKVNVINLLEHDPVHLAGVLVKAFPQNCQAVAKQLNALPGTEVHEISNEGAMVVTVEATEKEKNIVDIITHLSTLDGVLDASLIFHHNDAGLVPHQVKSPDQPINFR